MNLIQVLKPGRHLTN